MSDCFSQIFRFDCGSSVKLLSSKIEDMFLLSMVRFCSGRAYYHRVTIRPLFGGHVILFGEK